MTIEEAYVSFETAKLLKEKGFDEESTSFYFPFGTLSHGNTYVYCKMVVASNPDIILAPTHQMATRWLREIHKCFIQIKFANGCTSFTFFVYKNGTDFYPCNIYYGSYEEAVEEAIKYCLENLI